MDNELYPNQERKRKLLSERVALYSSRLEEYQKTTYNETQVRVDFVNPFFKALGWDVDNESGLPQHLREVTHEASVLVEENGNKRNKKPDYSFRIGTEPLFFLETKKPSVDIKTDKAPAFQLRRYGWSGNLKVSVLTNYTDLYIYDCSVRPTENDDVNVAMIAHYSFTEYEDKFDEIYALLSKESVLSGDFVKHFENISSPLRREPFDEYFLKQIKNWRENLGLDIRRNNPSIGEDTLNISVQRILNRIIFLRICEDRNLEQYQTLKNIQTYDELKKLFLNADLKYDSGLFETLEEDNVNVSDSILLDIFRNLYYPNNSYEFSVVDPFIIGQIYEIFLDERLIFSKQGDVIVEKKPEAVDSQGAVNTPKNVTDIIVENTLSEIIKGKSPSEIQNYKIADICCGAGNFLLSAFEYLVNYYIEWTKENELEKAILDGILIRSPGSDMYKLSYEMRRSILLRNIFGVDIDPLSVEVTKFSLFLKLLEDTSNEEIDSFLKESSERVLPRMDDNIKNGNSLIDNNYIKFDPLVYEREGALEQIKMFDWEEEFSPEGFNAIIGNPPYIRVQNMVRYSPMEYGFYKSEYSGYKTANSELLDKYYLFIEKAWMLLKVGGVIGYVVPHKFMNIKSGYELRRFLSENGCVKKIIHFGTNQAFKNRSTYTCILVLGKFLRSSFDISFIQDWNRFIFDHKTSYENYPIKNLDDKPWIFMSGSIEANLNEVKDKCSSLKELARIFVGVQTSNDKIYIINSTSEDSSYIYFTDKYGISRKVEKTILRKSVYDAKLKKYLPINPNSYIIFPYENIKGKPKLIDIEIMRKDYPYAYEYLSFFKDELSKRNMKITENTWYAYGRSQSLARFVSGEHLIWPVLSLDSNYVYDNDLTVFTGGGNGPFYGIEMKPETEESIFYIQAVLNHWLMESIVRKKASFFRGGYYSHGKQFVEELPIFRIDFSDNGQKQIHEKIVSQVHLLEHLNTRIVGAQNSSERKSLERALKTANKTLSEMIDFLYGVNKMQEEEVNESN